MCVCTRGGVLSCEIGLGQSVDTEPPTLTIENPAANAIIRDVFTMSGTWDDDGEIKDLTVSIVNTSTHIETASVKAVIDTASKTWSCTINPLADETRMLDGSYEANLSIKDTYEHETKASVAFKIDNTPPLVILTRPATKIDATNLDSYGCEFTLEGEAVDDNTISLVEVEVYDILTNEKKATVQLLNVAKKIDRTVATFGGIEYEEIFGEVEKDENSNYILDNVNAKDFYCKVIAYDDARKVPAVEGDKGNATSEFYLLSEISRYVSEYKSLGLYQIINGTYLDDGDPGRTSVNEIQKVLKDNKLPKASFSLDPRNNPRYVVSGRSNNAELKGYLSDPKTPILTQDAAKLNNGSTVEVGLYAGLDNYYINRDTVGIYLVECDENGKLIGNQKTVLFPKYKNKDGTVTKEDVGGIEWTEDQISDRDNKFKISGSTYSVNVQIGTNIKPVSGPAVMIGKYYRFVVDGYDEKGNNIFNYGNTDYAFKLASVNSTPTLTVTGIERSSGEACESTTSVDLNARDTTITIKGTATLDEPVPNVEFGYVEKDDDDKDVVIPIGTISASKFSAEGFVCKIDDKYKNKSFTIRVTARNPEDKNQTAVKDIFVTYDCTGPVIGGATVTPEVVDGEARYVNGKVVLKTSVEDTQNIVSKVEYTITPSGGKESARTTVESISSTGIPIDTTQYPDNAPLTVTVYAIDKPGNETSKSYTLNIKQSTDQPVITFNNADPTITDTATIKANTASGKQNNIFGIQSNNKLSVTITDDDGIKKVTLYRNGEAEEFVPTSISTAYSLNTEISKQQSEMDIQIKVEDSKDETSFAVAESPKFRVAVDEGAPNFMITTDNNALQAQNRDINVIGTVSDGTDVVITRYKYEKATTYKPDVKYFIQSETEKANYIEQPGITSLSGNTYFERVVENASTGDASDKITIDKEKNTWSDIIPASIVGTEGSVRYYEAMDAYGQVTGQTFIYSIDSYPPLFKISTVNTNMVIDTAIAPANRKKVFVKATDGTYLTISGTVGDQYPNDSTKSRGLDDYVYYKLTTTELTPTANGTYDITGWSQTKKIDTGIWSQTIDLTEKIADGKELEDSKMYILYIAAKDKAGNISVINDNPSSAVYIIPDRTKPTVSLQETNCTDCSGTGKTTDSTNNPIDCPTCGGTGKAGCYYFDSESEENLINTPNIQIISDNKEKDIIVKVTIDDPAKTYAGFDTVASGIADIKLMENNVDYTGAWTKSNTGTDYTITIKQDDPTKNALTTGTHDLTIRAIDKVGNYTDLFLKTIAVDVTPPTISITGVSPSVMDSDSNICYNGDITVSAIANDETNLDYIECWVEDSSRKEIAGTRERKDCPNVANKAETFVIKTDSFEKGKNTYYVCVQSFDLAGNGSDKKFQNIKVNQETDQPTIKLTNANKDITTLDGMRVAVAKGTTNNIFDTISNNVLIFTVTDDDGIDTVTVKSNKQNDTTVTTETYAGSTEDYPTSWTIRHELPNDKELYEIEIIVVDKLKQTTNYSSNSLGKFVVAIDDESPKIEGLTTTVEDKKNGDTYYVNNGFNVSFNVSDDYKLESLSYVETVSGTAEAEKSVAVAKDATKQAKTIDIAKRGNPGDITKVTTVITLKDVFGRSATEKLSYVFDLKKPTLSITEYTPARFEDLYFDATKTFTISGTANDEDGGKTNQSGLDVVEFAICKGNLSEYDESKAVTNYKWQETSGSLSWKARLEADSIKEDGYYTFFIRAKDKAGNYSDVTVVKVIADTKIPENAITKEPKVMYGVNDDKLEIKGTLTESHYKSYTVTGTRTDNSTSSNLTDSDYKLSYTSTSTGGDWIFTITNDITGHTKDGNYNITITFFDKTNKQCTYNIKTAIDTTPPTKIEITTPADGTKMGENAINVPSYKFEGYAKDNIDQNIDAVYYMIYSSDSIDFNNETNAPKYDETTKKWTSVVDATTTPEATKEWTLINTISWNGNDGKKWTDWNTYGTFRQTGTSGDGIDEGTYYIHVFATDKANNKSSVVNRQFEVDMFDPKLEEVETLITKDDTNYAEGNATNKFFKISGKASDTNGLETDATNTKGFVTITEYLNTAKTGEKTIKITDNDGKWDSGAIFPIHTGATTDGISNGDYTYTISVKDKVGKETKENVTVKFDTTGPETLKIKTPENDSVYTGKNSVTAEDTEINLVGNVKDNNNGVGTKYIYYKVILAENSAPTSKDGTTSWKQVAASDGTWNASYEFASYVEGCYKLYVYAEDELGNTSDIKGGVRIDFDKAVPIITNNSTQTGNTIKFSGTIKESNGLKTQDIPAGSGTYNLSITQTGPSNNTIKYYTVTDPATSGGDYTYTIPDGFPISVGSTPIEDGTYTFTIKTTDDVGKEGVATYSAYYDSTAPVVKIITPSSDTINVGTKSIAETSFKFEGSATDRNNIEVLKYQILPVDAADPFDATTKLPSETGWKDVPGTDKSSWSFDQAFKSGDTDASALGEGSYNLFVYAADEVGNTSKLEPNDTNKHYPIRKFDVDFSAPSISTETKKTGDASAAALAVETLQTYTKGYAFTFTIGDTYKLDGTTPYTLTIKNGTTYVDKGTTAGTYAITEDSGNAANNRSKTYTVTINSQADGDYTYTITAKDAMGKTTTVTRNIRLDTTGPVIESEMFKSNGTSLVSDWLDKNSTRVSGSLDDASGVKAVYITTDDSVDLPTAPSDGNWADSTIAWTEWTKITSATNTAWSQTLSSLADGETNLRVVAIDKFGNKSEKTYVLLVDTTEPVIDVTNLMKGAIKLTSDTTVDSNKTYYTLDSTSNVYVKVETPVLTDIGTYYELSAIQSNTKNNPYYVNNKDSLDSGANKFTLSGGISDNIKLKSLKLTAKNSDGTNEKTLIDTGSGDANLHKGVYKTSDNKAWYWTYECACSSSAFSDGEWTFDLEIEEDSSGHTASASYIVYIDTVAPQYDGTQLKINGEALASDSWYNQRNLRIQGGYTESGSGVQTVIYKLNTGEETEILAAGNTFDTTIMSVPDSSSNKSHNALVLKAVDKAGNESVIETIYIPVDMVAPTVKVNTDKTSANYETENVKVDGKVFTIGGTKLVNKQSDVTISIPTEDALSGVTKVQISLNGQDFGDGNSANIINATETPAGSGTWTCTIDKDKIPDGPIYANVVDNAGNSNQFQLLRFNVDNEPPTVSFISHTTGSTVNKTIELKGTVLDNQEVESVKLKILNADNETDVLLAETTLTPSGSNWTYELDTNSATYNDKDIKIVLTAVDKAGNTSSDTANSTTGHNPSITLHVDQNSDRPVIRLTNLSATTGVISQNKNVTVLVSDDDGLSGLVLKMATGDSAPTSWDSVSAVSLNSGSGSFDVGGEGLKKLWFYVKDAKNGVFVTNTSASTVAQKYAVPYIEYDDADGKTHKVDNNSTISYTYDNTAPVIELITYGFGPKAGTTATDAEKAAVKTSAESSLSATTFPGDNYDMIAEKCTTCSGTGKDGGGNCAACGGKGLIANSSVEKIIFGGKKKAIVTLAVKVTDANGVKSVVAKGKGISGNLVEDTTTHYWYLEDVELLREDNITITVTDNGGMTKSSDAYTYTIDNIAPVFTFTRQDKTVSPMTLTGTINETNEIVVFDYLVLNDAYYSASGEVNITAVNNAFLNKTYPTAYPSGSEATTSDFAIPEVKSLIPSGSTKFSGTSWSVTLDGNDLPGDGTKLGSMKFVPTVAQDVYNVRVYFRAVDNLGNEHFKYETITYDPYGTRPKAEVTYPTGTMTDPMGMNGSIRISGTSKQGEADGATAPKVVYVQFDLNKDGNFDADDLTLLKGYKDKSNNLLYTGSAANAVIEGTDAVKTAQSFEAINTEALGTETAFWGLPVLGTLNSWYRTINQYMEFQNDSTANDSEKTIFLVGARAIAIATDGTFGPWSDPQYIKIDTNVPQFGNVPTIVEKDSSDAEVSRRAYQQDMYLKGKTEIVVDIFDATDIAKVLVYEASRKEDLNKSSTTITTYDVGELTLINDASKFPENVPSTGKGYTLTHVLSDGTGSGSKYIKVEAYKGNENSSYEIYNMNFDNTAPTIDEFSLNSVKYAESDKKIVNSNGVFTLGGKMTDEHSGYDRVGFYFIRGEDKDQYNTRIYDPVKYTDNEIVLAEAPSDDNELTAKEDIADDQMMEIAGKTMYGITKTVSVSTTGDVSTITLDAADGNIKVGGLVYLGGSFLRIASVSGTTVTLSTVTTVSGTSETAFFPYLWIVDNTGAEKTDSDGLSFTTQQQKDSDDGDGMVESIIKNNRTWAWDATLQSQNIPDGPCKVIIFAWDKAGNISAASYDASIQNNAPRLVKLHLGTDLNGGGAYSNGDFVTYDVLNTVGRIQSLSQSTYANFKTADYKGKSFRVKDKLVVMPEFVGGNLPPKDDGTANKIMMVARPDASSVTEINKDGDTGTFTLTDVKDDAAKRAAGATFTSYSTSTTNLDDVSVTSNLWMFELINEQVGDESPADDLASGRGHRAMSFTFWDATADTDQGKNSCYYHLIINDLIVDVVDDDKPVVKIHPFYWNSKNDCSVPLDNKKMPLGHIDLEDNDNTDTSKRHANPWVSGQVYIRGTAYDNTRHGTITMITPKTGEEHVVAQYVNGGWITAKRIDKDTVKYSYKKKNSDGTTTTIDELTSSTTPAKPDWGWEDNWLNFEITKDSGITQDGHEVEWRFTVNMTPYGVATGKSVYAYATDAQDNDGSEAPISSGSTTTVRADINNTTTKSIAQTTTATETCRYEMDFVPYIKGIKGANRSRLGRYPVQAGSSVTIEGMNFVDDCTVKFYKSAADGSQGAQNTMLTAQTKTADADGNITITVPNYSCFVEVTVGGVPTKNNRNDNIKWNIEQGDWEVGDEKNGKNFWTDDRYLSVWKVGASFSGDVKDTNGNKTGTFTSANPIMGTIERLTSNSERFINRQRKGKNESGTGNFTDGSLTALWGGEDNMTWEAILSGEHSGVRGQGLSNKADAGFLSPPSQIDVCVIKGVGSTVGDMVIYGVLDDGWGDQGTFGNGLVLVRDGCSSTNGDYTIELTSVAKQRDQFQNIKVAGIYSDGAYHAYMTYYDKYYKCFKVAYSKFKDTLTTTMNKGDVIDATNSNRHWVIDGVENLNSGDDIGKWSDVKPVGGAPLVVYYDCSNQKLKYAKADATTPTAWATKGSLSKPTEYDFGRYVTIEVDSSNNVHIVAQEADNGILYYGCVPATSFSGSDITVDWHEIDATTSVGRWIDLKLESSTGKPIVTYMNGASLDTKKGVKVAYWDPAAEAWEAMIDPSACEARSDMKLSIVENPLEDDGESYSRCAIGINATELFVDFLRGEQ